MSWLHLAGLIWRGNLRHGSVTLTLFNPDQPSRLLSSGPSLPLLRVSQSMATVVKFYFSVYPFSHACEDLEGSKVLIPCTPLPVRKTLSTNLTLTPSLTFPLWLAGSVSSDTSPSPQWFLVISAAWAICVTSPWQPRAPPASFPLPRWWEPTIHPAVAVRSWLASLQRTSLFLSGSWYRGYNPKEKAFSVAFRLRSFHFDHLVYFKGEQVFAGGANKIKQEALPFTTEGFENYHLKGLWEVLCSVLLLPALGCRDKKWAGPPEVIVILADASHLWWVLDAKDGKDRRWNLS